MVLQVDLQSSRKPDTQMFKLKPLILQCQLKIGFPNIFLRQTGPLCFRSTNSGSNQVTSQRRASYTSSTRHQYKRFGWNFFFPGKGIKYTPWTYSTRGILLFHTAEKNIWPLSDCQKCTDLTSRAVGLKSYIRTPA